MPSYLAHGRYDRDGVEQFLAVFHVTCSTGQYTSFAYTFAAAPPFNVLSVSAARRITLMSFSIAIAGAHHRRRPLLLGPLAEDCVRCAQSLGSLCREYVPRSGLCCD